MPAPVDDVIAAVFFDLFLQPFACDAMGEEVGDDAALRVDVFFKELQQFPPLLARAERPRAARIGEHEKHAQCFIGRQCERLRSRRLHVVHHAHQQVALGERLLASGGPGDFPRHACQRGGEEIFLLRGARQLDAQRARGC